MRLLYQAEIALSLLTGFFLLKVMDICSLMITMKFPLNKKLKKELLNIIKTGSYPLNPVETGMKSRINPLKGIKAVIFDIYGTLFISASGDIGTAKENSKSVFMKEAIQKSGIVIKKNTWREEYTDVFYSLIEKHHAILRKKGHKYPEVNILEIWREFFLQMEEYGLIISHVTDDQIAKTSVHFEILTNPVWPMPGQGTILSILKGNGIPTGIISNAQFYTPLLFEALSGGTTEELGFKKELILYSFQYLHAKPSLFMFDKVSQQLYNSAGISCGEILYVGNDMLNDIKTASDSGMRTVLFAGDKRSLRLRENECADTVPDAVITSLEQLNRVIDIN